MSDTGGPAFPRTGVGNAGVSFDVPPQDGMTLLDYFAGQAISGVMSSLASEEGSDWEGGDFCSSRLVAAAAYKIAAAMLAEREKRNGGAT